MFERTSINLIQVVMDSDGAVDDDNNNGDANM